MRFRLLKFAPLALLVLASACSPVFPTIQPESTGQPQSQAGQQEGASDLAPTDTSPPAAADSTDAVEPPDPAPTDTAVPAVEPTSPDEQAVATDAPVAEECPYRPDLHATNPATVSLAAGEVQLVEFFAFW